MYQEIYSVLDKNRKSAHSTYRRLLKVKGLWCEVHIPVKKESIFGQEDIVEYDELQCEKKKLLVFGLFQEAQQGMQGFDSFIDSYILTPYHERLPLQTYVEVEFLGRKFSFKVDRHTDLAPSTYEQLFVKNILVPAT